MKNITFETYEATFENRDGQIRKITLPSAQGENVLKIFKAWCEVNGFKYISAIKSA